MLETSTQPKLTKKQQKAASFKSSKKSKGARHVPDGGDLPQMDDDDDPIQPEGILDAPVGGKENKGKKSKKTDKPDETEAAAVVDDEVQADKRPEAAEGKKDKKKSKKRKIDEAQADEDREDVEPAASPTKKDKKKKSRSAKANEDVAPAGAKKTTFGDDGQVASEQVAEPTAGATTSSNDADASGSSNNKLILFVGNMSFDLTSADIASHFGGTCGETPSVRLLTKKGDPAALASLSKSKQKSIAKGKAKDPSAPQSKGCAFLEFKTHAAVQKALRFHHTMLGGRQINVELTAGGGGKSAARKDKIAKKNQALEKERQKIHESFVAPAAASHKAKQAEAAARGEGGPPKKKMRSDSAGGEGGAQWGSRRGGGAGQGSRGGARGGARGGRGMPRFAASGANAVRMASS
ncbi:uncharacterized protein PFL1_03348 [Pseudozyma flocculosa PF-1]|uniref:Related to NOP6 - protein with possible role in rRNA processing n=2 Tax=Pseudozyma flocculosa TaxID=84751 RepID=A0A5C3F6A8_9BASI|nr:uncharacterized protein PFL1_03348 [Pseudozyma flocculosa PF-1]EPQ29059.1 hypothetical protein PFL1_03348 [Pseudozyma flocculosa PF-1]SPO40053.1 related to NOP6 - protein with possible role in rRNA processing [Pseudozyma flocculosa]